jgi:NitT/TauT family transport system permease protein
MSRTVAEDTPITLSTGVDDSLRVLPSGAAKDRVFVWVARVVLLVVVVGFWQLNSGGRGSLFPTYAFGTPAKVGKQFYDLFSTGAMYSDLGTTLLAVIYATLISIPIGVVLAVLTAVPLGRWLLAPLVTITYAIPKVGLITVFILVLGVDTKTHIALVAAGVLFIYYYGMRQAIDDVDQRRLLDMRLLGASRWKITRSLVFPGAVAQLIGATRLALPLAFGVEIFAELRIPTSRGLGALLQADESAQNIAGAVAVMIFVLLIGYGLDVGLGRMLRWTARSTGRGVSA